MSKVNIVINLKSEPMAKKVINEVNLQDMIAGLESSPAYSEYNSQP